MSVASYTAARILRILPRSRISQAMGRLSEIPLPGPVSRAITEAYCRAYAVDMQEVVPQPEPYPSFDAFFTRSLKPGVREISPDAVVSPADGRLSVRGRIDDDARISVKGSEYRVAELTGDSRDAARYRGGTFAVVYLSPRDYHRVHAPVSGKITLIRGIPGDLYPVNSIGERHIPRLFARNKRVTIVIESPEVGRVSVVMVGAVVVGRISVSVLPDPSPPAGEHPVEVPIAVAKGDEIGVFHLGSTVVLFLEPGHQIVRTEGAVRYGESLLKAS